MVREHVSAFYFGKDSFSQGNGVTGCQISDFRDNLLYFFQMKKYAFTDCGSTLQKPAKRLPGDILALCGMARFFSKKEYFLSRVKLLCMDVDSNSLSARLPDVIAMVTELLVDSPVEQKRSGLRLFADLLEMSNVREINQTMIRIIRGLSEAVLTLYRNESQFFFSEGYEFLLRQTLPLCSGIGFHLGLADGFLVDGDAGKFLELNPPGKGSKKSACLKQLQVRMEVTSQVLRAMTFLDSQLPGLCLSLKSLLEDKNSVPMKPEDDAVSPGAYQEISFDLDEYYGRLALLRGQDPQHPVTDPETVRNLIMEISDAPVAPENGVSDGLKGRILRSIIHGLESSKEPFRESLKLTTLALRKLNEVCLRLSGSASWLPEQLCEERYLAGFKLVCESEGGKEFLVHLGCWLDPAGLSLFLDSADLTLDQKSLLIFGHVYFHGLYPAYEKLAPEFTYCEETVSKIRGQLESVPAQQERFRPEGEALRRLSQETCLNVKNYHWACIKELAGLASCDPALYQPLIRLLTVVVRLKRMLPEGSVDPINIEEIPKELAPCLARMFAWSEDLETVYPFLRSLLRVLPLDSFLINEIRIKVYILFRDSPARARFQDILRYIMHDSPSPYHLEIMKVFVAFLESGRCEEREALDRVMLPYKNIYDPAEEDRSDSLEVPKDFIQQLGDSYESVRQTAIEVRDLYEDLYGHQQARAIVRTLIDQKNRKYIDSQSDLKKKIIRFLNEISRHQIEGEHIPNGMAKYFTTFGLENFSRNKRHSLLHMLAGIHDDLQELIRHPDVGGSARVYFLRLHNAFEPLCFSLMASFQQNIKGMSDEEQNGLIHLMCGFIQADLGWKSREYQELDLIKRDSVCGHGQGIPPLKWYGILNRLERVVNRISSGIMDSYQERAEKIAGNFAGDLKVIRDFAPDMIRESVLFTASALIEEVAAECVRKCGKSQWHVTRGGKAAGPLRHFKSCGDLADARLTGHEIIVIPSLSPETPFPDVAGIISRRKEGSLSHLAIIAGYRKVPWLSPDPALFRRIQCEAGNSGSTFAEIETVHDGVQFRISKNRSILQGTENAGGQVSWKKQEKSPAPVDIRDDFRCHMLSPEEYTEALTGPKACKLSRLGRMFPGSVPPHVALGFGFFVSIMQEDPGLVRLVEKLQEEPENYKPVLTAVRDSVKGFLVSADVRSKVLNLVRRGVGEDCALIVRSSTNCEDLEDYPGAGIYHSVPDVNEECLFEAILEVWASFWSERAWTDRRREGFREKVCFPAVIIQKMFYGPQLHSFVIHTSDPLSHSPDVAVIEIAQGFGEAIVGSDEDFAGSPHRFHFHKKKGSLTRAAYADKSFRMESGQIACADYSSDPLSLQEIPLEGSLKNMFRAALQVEWQPDKSKREPQDIEGAFCIRGEQAEFCFVQTRRQLIHPVPEVKSGQGGTLVVRPEKSPPTDHVNPVLLPPLPDTGSKFNLPEEIFAGKNANLIELWLEAFSTVASSPGTVVIRPYGSLSYLDTEQSILWDKVDDFDLFFCLTSCTTREAAWEFEKKYSLKIRDAFIEKSRSLGLVVNHTAKGRFALAGTTRHGKRIWEMKDVNLKYIPLPEYFSGSISMREPAGFLPWSRIYSDCEGYARFYNFAFTNRLVDAEHCIRNCEKQYAFAYHRAHNDTPFRKLKELNRLAPVQQLEKTSKHSKSLLMSCDHPEDLTEGEVMKLWNSLPLPGSPELRNVQERYANRQLEHLRVLSDRVNARLKSFEILPGKGVYYSFGFPKDSCLPEVLACALIRSWLDTGRLFFLSSLQKYREKALREMARIFEESNGLSSAISTSLSELIIAGSLCDFDHTVAAVTSETDGSPAWQNIIPELNGRSDDVSVMDIIMGYLGQEAGITDQDRILLDHIDPGCLAAVPLILSRRTYDPGLMKLIHRAADLHEKPQVGEQVTLSRFSGEDAAAQLFILSVAGMIKAVRTRKMSEQEAILYMRGRGESEKPVLERFSDLAVQLYKGQTVSPDLARGHFRSLKQQWIKCKSGTGHLYEIYAGGLVAAVHDKHGIQDTGLKYTYMPEGAGILVQYSVLLDRSKNHTGWRYHSVGRDPRKVELSLAGLVNTLNKREEELHQRVAVLRTQKWVTKTHESAVCFGPVGKSSTDVSLIPPPELAKIIENHVSNN